MAEVKMLFRQTSEATADVAGDYFEAIYKKYKGDPFVEVQEFENKNARVTLLKMDNRTKAFCIENRT